MVQLDDDFGPVFGEHPGDLAASIIEFPRQRVDATRRCAVDDVVASIETHDGEVIDDIDLDDVEIEAGDTRGTFVMRARRHHNRALATGAIVTGGALIAASLGIRYRARR